MFAGGGAPEPRGSSARWLRAAVKQTALSVLVSSLQPDIIKGLGLGPATLPIDIHPKSFKYAETEALIFAGLIKTLRRAVGGCRTLFLLRVGSYACVVSEHGVRTFRRLCVEFGRA